MNSNDINKELTEEKIDISNEVDTLNNKDASKELDSLNNMDTSKEIDVVNNIDTKEIDKTGKNSANLYMKVQNIIKNAKLEKYMNDKEKIVDEGITLLGGFTGKNSLQIERLKNVKLKIELLQSQKIGVKQDYKCEELMADLYACAISELGGTFSLDMQKMYREIKHNYLKSKDSDETENYIYELACKKMDNGQNYLPIIHEEKPKGVFGDVRVQTKFLKLENKKLQNEIIIQRGKSQFETFKKMQEKDSVIVPVDWKNRKNA